MSLTAKDAESAEENVQRLIAQFYRITLRISASLR